MNKDILIEWLDKFPKTFLDLAENWYTIDDKLKEHYLIDLEWITSLISQELRNLKE